MLNEKTIFNYIHAIDLYTISCRNCVRNEMTDIYILTLTQTFVSGSGGFFGEPKVVGVFDSKENARKGKAKLESDNNLLAIFGPYKLNRICEEVEPDEEDDE